MTSLRILFMTLALTAMATAAFAVPYTFTFTADNELTDLTYSMNGQAAETVSSFAGITNIANWQKADTLTVDLATGETYELLWRVENYGAISNNNPFAFLADVTSAHGDNYSTSATWEVANEVGGTPGTWVTAREYAFNSGALIDGSGNSIWNRVNGGAPIAGISDDAKWIGVEEYPGASANAMYVRMSVTATPVPAAAWLLGSGLLSLLGIRRLGRQ